MRTEQHFLVSYATLHCCSITCLNKYFNGENENNIVLDKWGLGFFIQLCIKQTGWFRAKIISKRFYVKLESKIAGSVKDFDFQEHKFTVLYSILLSSFRYLGQVFSFCHFLCLKNVKAFQNIYTYIYIQDFKFQFPWSFSKIKIIVTIKIFQFQSGKRGAIFCKIYLYFTKWRVHFLSNVLKKHVR